MRLSAGDELWFWEIHRSATPLALTTSEVSVVGPDGSQIAVWGDQDAVISRGSYLAEAFAAVTAPTSGTYQVVVGNLTATYPPDSSATFALSRGDLVSTGVENALGAVFLWAGAGFVLVAGAGLMIGAVLWGSNRARGRYRPPTPPAR